MVVYLCVVLGSYRLVPSEGCEGQSNLSRVSPLALSGLLVGSLWCPMAL